MIGINSQIATGGGGGGSVGIGFAVPINTVKKVAAQLKDKGKVDHAFLGITGVSITKSMSDSLNLPTDRACSSSRRAARPRRRACKGGDTQVSIGGADLLLGGDVLTKIDGKQVKSMEDVIRVVDSKEPGDQVTLTLLRGKQRAHREGHARRAVPATQSGFEVHRHRSSRRESAHRPHNRPRPLLGRIHKAARAPDGTASLRLAGGGHSTIGACPRR